VLIIDAMDLLHTRELGGFCLVSSDSDFTRLATRIREDGLPVYGFGEEKTPRSFINACDRFIYTEIFRTKAVGSSKAVAPAKSGPLRDFNSDEGFKVALDQSIDAATAESGRANLGAVGNHLLKLLPDFDPRNYGFRKLSDLVEKNPSLRLVREKSFAPISTQPASGQKRRSPLPLWRRPDRYAHRNGRSRIGPLAHGPKPYDCTGDELRLDGVERIRI